METKPIATAAGVKSRSLLEAHSEVARELSVRRRCYQRWIQDGKLSSVEACDRLERLERALDELEKAILRVDLEVTTAAWAMAQPPTMAESSLQP
jgi:hypothetical protein